MNAVIFTTKQSALDYGFVPVKQVAHYRGFVIRGSDVTSGRAYGYEWRLNAWATFAVLARLRGLEYLSGLDVGSDVGSHCDSVDVWLTNERNAGGGVGCIYPMFSPSDYTRRVAELHAAIDSWYLTDDGVSVLAAQAEIDARHAAKARRRAERLAAKYGRGNLSERHQQALR